MFDNLLFVFRNNVMFKNIDSQPRIIDPKPAIPDTLFHKFGLAKVSSNFKLIDIYRENSQRSSKAINPGPGLMIQLDWTIDTLESSVSDMHILLVHFL